MGAGTEKMNDSDYQRLLRHARRVVRRYPDLRRHVSAEDLVNQVLVKDLDSKQEDPVEMIIEKGFYMTVELTEIRDVRPKGRPIQFFATTEAAIAHICNHLLTAPECKAWAFLLDDQEDLVNASDPDERYRLAKAAVRGDCERVRPLYDRYANAVSRACDDARKLGWRAQGRDEDKRIEALGLTGVYVVCEPSHVVTAYLPGQSKVDERIFESTPTVANPLPREGNLGLPDWKAGRRVGVRKGFAFCCGRNIRKGRQPERSARPGAGRSGPGSHDRQVRSCIREDKRSARRRFVRAG